MTNNLTASPEKVQDIVNNLTDSMQEWVKENPDTPVGDVFMGVHNFHKVMVRELAYRLSLEGVKEEGIYKIADRAWRLAMRDLKNQLPMTTTSRPASEPSRKLQRIVPEER